jgi:endoglucanase
VTDAAAVRRIAASPAAKWFGDWNGPDPAGAVKRLVDRAAGAQRLPVLVAYDLPGRDCGSYSAGGAPSAAAYRTWIDGFARGVDGRPAAVVVEPDALAGLDCRAAASQAQTLGLLRYAVQKLAAGSTTVYLDAGHDGWQPAAVMADRLRSAGVALARGFALNVSNFKSTGAELLYGRDIAARLPNAHFVIDTSRNGAGPAPDGVWCNPPGRSLGVRPTSSTGAPEADAFLWIKPPGESDGTCNGGPGAGQFWLDYALALAGTR